MMTEVSKKRLYVTTLMSAHNCAYQRVLKTAGFEPLPASESMKTGILLENALKVYLSERPSDILEAVSKANTEGLPQETCNFVAKAIKAMPEELLSAKEVLSSVFFERQLGDYLISGYLDFLVDGEVYELKYTSKAIKEPQKTHVFQVQHYLYLTEKEAGRILYVVDTRNPYVVVFEVPVWPQEKYIATLRGLEKSYTSEAPLGLIHDWLCGYCSFRHVCKYFNMPDGVKQVQHKEIR